jgi:hypothetical protein
MSSSSSSGPDLTLLQAGELWDAGGNGSSCDKSPVQPSMVNDSGEVFFPA